MAHNINNMKFLVSKRKVDSILLYLKQEGIYPEVERGKSGEHFSTITISPQYFVDVWYLGRFCGRNMSTDEIIFIPDNKVENEYY